MDYKDQKDPAYRGWFWDSVTRKLYRWNDLVDLIKNRDANK